MSNITVEQDAIHKFAEATSGIAAAVVGAATVDQAASIAAAVPVFGLIGQEFLAGFAVAQGNNLASVVEVAAVHTATAVTAHKSAESYTETDASAASAVLAVVKNI